jgi:hypothetical protein
MDFSQYIKMKMKAANTYKSNWQGRDASEVTLRRAAISNKNDQRQAVANGIEVGAHQGPILPCCTKPPNPINGYSTDYSMDIVSNKKAGCVNCHDPNWGAPFGVQLLSCAAVQEILSKPNNPIKGTGPIYNSDYPIPVTPFPCKGPGIDFSAKAAQIESQCGQASPAYTGSRNQVPTNGRGNTLLQVPKYASG